MRGLLHDCRVFTRRGPDDSVYDNNLDIRQKVARGNCFLEILDGEDAGTTCLVSIGIVEGFCVDGTWRQSSGNRKPLS